MVDKLILRELNENDEAAFFEGMKDWSKEDRSWYTFEWEDGRSFRDLLERLKDYEAGLNLPEGRVPSTMLYAFVDSRIVGRVSLRHQLNDALRTHGGHVGYAVAEKFRRRGYAKEIMKQTIPFCRRLGLAAIFMTCADTNIASCKVIENAGGALVDKAFDDEKKETIRRYWLKVVPTTPPAFKPQPTFETERLVLRPLTMKDSKRFQQIANDERISATTSHPFPFTQGVAEERIAQLEPNYHRGDAVYFGLVLKETNELIGGVLLFSISKPHEKAELGYWIGVDYWNKGYTTEAVAKLINYGFNDLGINRIYAKYVASNEASGRVMEKAGMSKEGCLREDIHREGLKHDLVYYGILRGEFKN